jgi:hypothetical protein
MGAVVMRTRDRHDLGNHQSAALGNGWEMAQAAAAKTDKGENA